MISGITSHPYFTNYFVYCLGFILLGNLMIALGPLIPYLAEQQKKLETDINRKTYLNYYNTTLVKQKSLKNSKIDSISKTNTKQIFIYNFFIYHIYFVNSLVMSREVLLNAQPDFVNFVG